MPTSYAYAGKPPGLTGRYHWGRGAIGVPGANIPLTGENGPSLIGLDIAHPSEDADEFRVLVLTVHRH